MSITTVYIILALRVIFIIIFFDIMLYKDAHGDNISPQFIFIIMKHVTL